MAPHTVPQRKDLSGSRRFTWYQPAGTAPTEYEDLTIHQQSSPEHYAFQGWPIRFDDGSDPCSAESTRIRSTDWFGYRDPNRTMQRTYVSALNETERALERSISGARTSGLFSLMKPGWAETGLQHFLTYPFIHYGLFLSLCYAERQALSDSTTISIVFSAADKLRHLQDAVFYSFELAEVFPGFSDAGAKAAWKEQPIWQGARRAVENISVLRDWVEVLVATNLCFDPLFGELAHIEYFSRFAAANGDVVTPILIASAEADLARTRRWTVALMRHVLEDAVHGAANREVLTGWVEKWNGYSLDAAEAFRPVFSESPNHSASFEEALARVQARQAALLEPLGLAPRTQQQLGRSHG